MKRKSYEAVIACGGRGSRLKNITGSTPKPLFPINGKSTIERCIQELSNNSIGSVLITLGYKNESFLKDIKKLEKNILSILIYLLKIFLLVNAVLFGLLKKI